MVLMCGNWSVNAQTSHTEVIDDNIRLLAPSGERGSLAQLYEVLELDEGAEIF